MLKKMRTQKFHTLCKLDIPKVKLVFSDNKRDFDYNTEIEIKVNYYDYFIAYLWKVNDEIIKDETVMLS